MSHSHLSLRHFILQLDSNRSDGPRGVQLSEWLQSFIQEAAECFEPDRESARAGYVCSCVNDGWMVQLFLGLTEVVGGPEDGASIPAGFRFDLEAARSLFDEVGDVFLDGTSDKSSQTDDLMGETMAAIAGKVGGHSVTLEVLHRPPADMGPGLLQYTDGRCEMA